MGAGQVIIVLLAVVGLCSLMQWLMHLLYRTGGQTGTLVLVLHLSEHREDVEYVLRCARNQLREAEGFSKKQLVVVDDGMDSQTKRLCTLFLHDKPGAVICSAERFANMEEMLYTDRK
ncbi:MULTISPECIES: hypothetical protein [Caproicibacterium]|uniref:Uncharacterized protein n=1 Tax=Caproicibacterium argilliputei TaxID=3030016 RepID=A0AA97H071_9FIRM|nr:hypothetical protein [Caproicibacterium argilliputei]WOC31183.1 hypothetical protein PXC00_08080 [Caproicibacterium argilliputei]